MDDDIRKAILREQLMQKHAGKKAVISKYHTKYPDSAEREYIRLANSFMDIEKQVLLKYIPELKQIMNDTTAGHNMDSKGDDNEKRRRIRFEKADNTLYRLRMIFESIRKELNSTIGLYHLTHELNRVAALDHKLTVMEWKKTISKTFGIDILEDYYSGDSYKKALEKWVSDNVDLISTVPNSSLSKMKELVYRSYMDGKPVTNIVKEIQRQYQMDKRHAHLIARDQTAKLNAVITQRQQTDAGVSRYEWSTSGDERVRKSHKKLDGRIFSWSDPPETDKGRLCHPGEDYQCRCCALPVFDIDTVDLPA